MTSRIGGVVWAVGLLFLVVGCDGPASKTRKVLLEDSGIFGEHSLVRIERLGAVEGSVSGSFFWELDQ